MFDHSQHLFNRKQAIKQRLMDAFSAYQQREPGSLDKLINLMRDFAYKKLYGFELEFRDFGTAETVDDWAQDVTVKVWQYFERHPEEIANMKPASFYAWFHRTVHNHGNDVITELLEQRSQNTGVMVVREGDDGAVEEDDNPEIYADNSPYSDFRMPEDITGINRDLCRLIMSEVSNGKGGRRERTYAEIGETLGISEGAVKQRLRGMRKSFEKYRRKPKGKISDPEERVAAD